VIAHRAIGKEFDVPPALIACLAGVVVFCVTALVLFRRAGARERERWSPQVNRRKEPRVPVNSEFDLFWQDVDASHKSTRARGIEISAHGASVRSSKPILCNSVITVRARHIRFEGKAVVRRCTRNGLSYIIGLELEGEPSSLTAMRA
jgi:hypothetical protein